MTLFLCFKQAPGYILRYIQCLLHGASLGYKALNIVGCRQKASFIEGFDMDFKHFFHGNASSKHSSIRKG